MIELYKVSKEYNNRYTLKDVTLTFPDNGLIAIVGESGSGKTSLLNIMGMLDHNYYGKLLFDGKEYTSDEERSKFRLQNISYIFQESSMLPYLSIKENISLQPDLSGKKMDESKVKRFADRMSVGELSDRKINELSGGQKQRLAILRAFATGNKTILADEPTGNLDEETATRVFEVLKEVSSDALVIVVTHDRTLAEKYADQILKIENGTVIQDELPCSHYKTIIGETEKKIKRFPIYWRMIKGDLKNKPKIVKKMISGMLLAIIVVSLCVTFSLAVLSTNRNNELFIMESNLLTISGKYDKNCSLMHNSSVLSKIIPLEDKELFKDDCFEEVVYSYNLTLILKYGGKSVKLKHVETIENDDFFKNKMKTLEIDGSFPESNTDLIISYEEAKELFPNSSLNEILGQTVIVDYVKPVEMRIVGINRKANMSGHVNSFVMSGAVKIIKDPESISKGRKQVCIFTDLFFKKHPELFNNSSMRISSLRVAVADIEEEKEINLICGRKVEREGEVVLGLKHIEEDGENFSAAGKNKTELMEYAQSLLESEIVCGNESLIDCIVVGIVDDRDRDEMKCYLSRSDRLRMAEPAPVEIRAYVSAQDKVEEIKKEISSRGFNVDAPYYYVKESVGKEFDAVGVVLIAIGVLIFLSSVKNVSILLKNNVDQSMNEIGLIRTIGLSGKEVRRFYFMESMTIALFVMGAGMVIFPICLFMLEAVTKTGKLQFVTVDTIAVLAGFVTLILFTVFEVVLATRPSMRRIEKFNIIDLVRNIEK